MNVSNRSVSLHCQSLHIGLYVVRNFIHATKYECVGVRSIGNRPLAPFHINLDGTFTSTGTGGMFWVTKNCASSSTYPTLAARRGRTAVHRRSVEVLINDERYRVGQIKSGSAGITCCAGVAAPTPAIAVLIVMVVGTFHGIGAGQLHHQERISPAPSTIPMTPH